MTQYTSAESNNFVLDKYSRNLKMAACQKARGHYRRWQGKQRQQQHNTETKA